MTRSTHGRSSRDAPVMTKPAVCGAIALFKRVGGYGIVSFAPFPNTTISRENAANRQVPTLAVLTTNHHESPRRDAWVMTRTPAALTADAPPTYLSEGATA